LSYFTGYRSHIFDPFFRAANAKDVEGTGLGLSIVKHTVDLLDGTISCDSIERLGTVFVVNLPMTIEMK
jgi:two-component system, LuxR family, sensor kinase FixL